MTLMLAPKFGSHIKGRRARRYRGGRYTMQKKSINEIAKELGLENTMPIALSKDDQEDVDAKGDTFRSWYEEEMREFYENN